jgi:hypothetical protein
MVEGQEMAAIRRGLEKEGRGILLLGPTGPGSGNSILDAAVLPDFTPRLAKDIRDRITFLPYYAFHPPFLFEEETCQALYFSGQTPDPASPAAGLKAYNW